MDLPLDCDNFYTQKFTINDSQRPNFDLFYGGRMGGRRARPCPVEIAWKRSAQSST